MGIDCDADLYFGVQLSYDQIIQLCRVVDTVQEIQSNFFDALSISTSRLIACYAIEQNLDQWEATLEIPASAIKPYERDDDWYSEQLDEEKEQDAQEQAELEKKWIKKQKEKYIKQARKSLLKPYEDEPGEYITEHLLQTHYYPLQIGYASHVDRDYEEWTYYIHFPFVNPKKRKGMSDSISEWARKPTHPPFTASFLTKFFVNVDVSPWKRLCQDVGWKYEAPTLQCCASYG